MTTGALLGFAAPPAAACEPPKSCGSCWVNKDIPERIDDPIDPRRIVWIECHS
jgi:hypothetical protein